MKRILKSQEYSQKFGNSNLKWKELGKIIFRGKVSTIQEDLCNFGKSNFDCFTELPARTSLTRRKKR